MLTLSGVAGVSAPAAQRGAGHTDAISKGAHFVVAFFDKHVKPL
jgi:hypothetical protein